MDDYKNGNVLRGGADIVVDVRAGSEEAVSVSNNTSDLGSVKEGMETAGGDKGRPLNRVQRCSSIKSVGERGPIQSKCSLCRQ